MCLYVSLKQTLPPPLTFFFLERPHPPPSSYTAFSLSFSLSHTHARIHAHTHTYNHHLITLINSTLPPLLLPLYSQTSRSCGDPWTVKLGGNIEGWKLCRNSKYLLYFLPLVLPLDYSITYDKNRFIVWLLYILIVRVCMYFCVCMSVSMPVYVWVSVVLVREKNATWKKVLLEISTIDIYHPLPSLLLSQFQYRTNINLKDKYRNLIDKIDE